MRQTVTEMRCEVVYIAMRADWDASLSREETDQRPDRQQDNKTEQQMHSISSISELASIKSQLLLECFESIQ